MSSEHDRDDTPPRRPSNLRIAQWGIVQAWLCGSGRGISLLCDDHGQLTLVAIDPINGQRKELVPAEEDPSKAALRAIGRMNTEPAA